jgi:hypothetical protein
MTLRNDLELLSACVICFVEKWFEPRLGEVAAEWLRFKGLLERLALS